MNVSNNKKYLFGGLGLITTLILFYFVGEIILPFILGIFIAYLINPLILIIQRKIKNRNLAITSFLFASALLLGGILIFFGEHAIKDTKRFVSAVEIFANDHEKQIKELKQNVFGLLNDVSNNETVQNIIDSADTLTTEEKEEDVMSALSTVYSFFETPTDENVEPTSNPWSVLYIICYVLLYTVLILYSYPYFEEKYAQYDKNRKEPNEKREGIWLDFETNFLVYFKQRGIVLLINVIIFVIAFSIIDLPGAIIIGIISGILSYASHFHYLSLPLVAVGCWVISVENNGYFLVYFGILLAVFVLISILEETIYFNKIMKSVNGMNPAIMVLSFALWIYLFGSFAGTIIALPLTQLILILIDRYLLNSKQNKII